MKPRESLQTIIDPFVTSCGGELVADLLETNVNLPQNADYFFRQHGVIAELKALENDSFGEPFQRKMENPMGSWQRRGLLIVYGRQRIELTQLPSPCQEEALNIIGKPLEDNILSKAHEQIRATKEVLKMPDAKGLLIVASDGNEDLQPNDVWFFLTRFRKTHPDGRPQFSSIHSLLYFNLRMPVLLPGTGQPTLLWMSGARQTDDYKMVSFLNTLADAWPRYMERTMGLPFPRVELEPTLPRTFRFAGVSRRLPRFQVTDSSQKNKT